jgi:hypothetical protein
VCNPVTSPQTLTLRDAMQAQQIQIDSALEKKEIRHTS